MTPSLVVVGSLNMDFVARVERLPAPGETVLGHSFQMIPGGKGANQAVAAGRLARTTRVRMIGRVGYDLFADHLKASLAAAGVDVTHVHGTRAEPTGIALICVDGQGQNSIVVASGANHALAASEVEAMRPVFRGARCALFQLETPLSTVERALAVARQEVARTILDPAPAQPLTPSLLSAVDILTPNEMEACVLLGRAPARVSIAEASAIADALLETQVNAVILKLGDQGCFYRDRERSIHSPAFAVECVDATAAGDTFNAAFAVALAEDQPLETALRFANAAAALSVTRVGAQASIPSLSEVEAFCSAGPGLR